MVRAMPNPAVLGPVAAPAAWAAAEEPLARRDSVEAHPSLSCPGRVTSRSTVAPSRRRPAGPVDLAVMVGARERARLALAVGMTTTTGTMADVAARAAMVVPEEQGPAAPEAPPIASFIMVRPPSRWEP